jgi:hypothetical protein
MGQIVNISDFAAHTACIAITQHHQCIMKASIDNIQKNEYGSMFQQNFIYKTRWRARFDLRTPLFTLVLEHSK